MATTSPACVLLSGGIDSAVVASVLLEDGRPVSAIFVDYGQPSARAERRASRAVAEHLALRWREVVLSGFLVPTSGEIPGRNDLLISVAKAAEPECDIAIGVHAGTGYADCSPAHHVAWQGVMDSQHAGRRRVLAPLVELSKGDVLGLARELSLPVAITHSCETGEDACGSCRSCLDREVLVVWT